MVYVGSTGDVGTGDQTGGLGLGGQKVAGFHTSQSTHQCWLAIPENWEEFSEKFRVSISEDGLAETLFPLTNEC